MSDHKVYNTPLLKKIGIKGDQANLLIHAPDNIIQIVQEDQIAFDKKLRPNTIYNLIWLFTNQLETMESTLSSYKKLIHKNGVIWISWYKKASKKPTELNEDIIRETALALELVDVKVVSVDEQWSALKLVIPLNKR